MADPEAFLIAGIPNENRTLFHQVRFGVGDPAALIVLKGGDGQRRRHFILRDIEMDRARKQARADEVHCPAEFTPAAGLSGDRETATAQSVAEFLRRRNLSTVTADRTLPLSYIHELRQAGIEVQYDPNLGVVERRVKDEQEIAYLHQAQRDTEQIVRRVCELIAKAKPDRDGVLLHEGAALTSERLFTWIDIQLLEAGYDNPHRSIIAGGSQGGDCHNRGSGALRTGELVIVDIFPRNKTSLYHGDCTRTVVHGAIPDVARKMHAVVVEAKAAAMKAVRAGVTGHDVNQAMLAVMTRHGYPFGLPPADAPREYISIPHGTGHGVGLDIHEPPLLADKGPVLLAGDCVTVEPGLYGPQIGGVRIEDMVIVNRDGCRNLSALPEGLVWA